MESARRGRMKLLESASARTDFFVLRGTLAFELINKGFCNSNMALRYESCTASWKGVARLFLRSWSVPT
eukprot:279692-Pleurochrysis_carterae.AAC.1